MRLKSRGGSLRMCFSQDRELGVGSSQNHFAEEDRNRNLNQQRIIRFANGLKTCTEVE